MKHDKESIIKGDNQNLERMSTSFPALGHQEPGARCSHKEWNPLLPARSAAGPFVAVAIIFYRRAAALSEPDKHNAEQI